MLGRHATAARRDGGAGHPAHVPVEVLNDVIQPFPSSSGIYDAAAMTLRMQIADKPPPARSIDAQMASLSG